MKIQVDKTQTAFRCLKSFSELFKSMKRAFDALEQRNNVDLGTVFEGIFKFRFFVDSRASHCLVGASSKDRCLPMTVLLSQIKV